MQIIANRAPIGFEAEFVNQRGANICYRGILMPFSSDGDTIDFIYGVINWKTVDAAAAAEPSPTAELPPPAPAEPEDVLLLDEEIIAEPAPDPAEVVAESVETGTTVEPVAEEQPLELDQPVAEAKPLELDQPLAEEEPLELGQPAGGEPVEAPAEEHLAWEDSPSAEPETDAVEEPEPAAAPVHFAWEDGPLADAEPDEIAELVLDENAGLADRLWAARETAESVKAGEGRTRVALYRALSLAYDFAVAALQNPQEYAELLEESGMKAQARAPMTPIVKLVFGIDYDKARLTEFAAALSFAQRQDIGLGGFKEFIEKQPGGLKALVAAERQARRPEAKADTKTEAARAKLRSARSISLADVPAEEEFAVIVTRRGADGIHEPVAIVDDESLVERAIRRAA
jgi:hypothetical protein